MQQKHQKFSIDNFELESYGMEQQLRQKIHKIIQGGMLEDQEYPIVIWDGYGDLAIPLKAYSITLKQGIISCLEIQIVVDLLNPRRKYDVFYLFERNEVLEGENVKYGTIYCRNENTVSAQRMDVVKYDENQTVLQKDIQKQIVGKDNVKIDISFSNQVEDIDISEFNNIQSAQIFSSKNEHPNFFSLPTNLKYLSLCGQFGLLQQLGQLCSLQSLYLSNLENKECLILTNLTKLRILRIMQCELNDIKYPHNVKTLGLKNCKYLELPKCESIEDLTLVGKNFVGVIDCKRIKRIDLRNCNTKLTNTSVIEEIHTDCTYHFQSKSQISLLDIDIPKQQIDLSQFCNLNNLQIRNCDLHDVITPNNNIIIECILIKVSNLTQGFLSSFSNLMQLQLSSINFDSINLKNTYIQCIIVTLCKFSHIILPLFIKCIEDFSNSARITIKNKSVLTKLDSIYFPQIFCNQLKYIDIYSYYSNNEISKEDFEGKSVKFCPRLKAVYFNDQRIEIEVSRQPEQSQIFCDQISSNLCSIDIKSKKAALFKQQTQLKIQQVAQILSKMDAIHDFILSVE